MTRAPSYHGSSTTSPVTHSPAKSKPWTLISAREFLATDRISSFGLLILRPSMWVGKTRYWVMCSATTRAIHLRRTWSSLRTKESYVTLAMPQCSTNWQPITVDLLGHPRNRWRQRQYCPSNASSRPRFLCSRYWVWGVQQLLRQHFELQ